MSVPTDLEKTLNTRIERFKRLRNLAERRDEAESRRRYINAVILRELQEAYAEGVTRVSVAPALGMTEAGVRAMERRAAK